MSSRVKDDPGRITSQHPRYSVGSHYDGKAQFILSFLFFAVTVVQVLAIVYGEIEFTITIDTYWLGVDVSFDRLHE